MALDHRLVRLHTVIKVRLPGKALPPEMRPDVADEDLERGPRPGRDHGRTADLQPVLPRRLGGVRRPPAAEERREPDGRRLRAPLRPRAGRADPRQPEERRVPLRDPRRRDARGRGRDHASDKAVILDRHEKEASKIEAQYRKGIITDDERRQELITIWTQATDEVKDAMEAQFGKTNPIYMMANSGARGTSCRSARSRACAAWWPTRRARSSRVRSSRTSAKACRCSSTSSRPTAPKGLADTALRTADSGYLTRRLVDVSQELIVREEDCGPTVLAGPGHLRDAPGRARREPASRHVAVRARARRGREGRAQEGRLAGRLPRRRGRAAPGRGRRRRGPCPVGDDLRGGVRRLPALLRMVARDGAARGHRRVGGDRGRAVDRRAGDAAHDADVPHRRRRRRGHHARSASCRGAVRGPPTQGRGVDHRDPRHRPDRGRRGEEGAPDHRHLRGRQRLGAVQGRVPGTAARRRRRRGRGGPAAHRGLGEPAREAADRGRAGPAAPPRRGGPAGVPLAGRDDPRQAHRADRAADAAQGADHRAGRHGLPARGPDRPARFEAANRETVENSGQPASARPQLLGITKASLAPIRGCRRPPSRRPRGCSPRRRSPVVPTGCSA